MFHMLHGVGIFTNALNIIKVLLVNIPAPWFAYPPVLEHSYGKSACFMGKITNSMDMLNSHATNYRRVNLHFPMIFPWFSYNFPLSYGFAYGYWLISFSRWPWIPWKLDPGMGRSFIHRSVYILIYTYIYIYIFIYTYI